MSPQQRPAPRLRHRRRLLAWSAPAVLLALLAAALLLGVTAGNHLARVAHDGGDHAAAAERYAYQQRWTARGIEPWKAWFNAGTAELGAGEHFRATEQLRGALARVPAGTTDTDGAPDPAAPECRVRTNLSLALEGLGDEASTGMAEQYYTEAMEAVAPCSSDGEPETDAEEPEEPQSAQDRAEQRQRDKRDRADQPPAAEDQQQEEQPSPEPSPTQPPQDPRLEELEERNREAERERDQQQQERGGGPGTGQNW